MANENRERNTHPYNNTRTAGDAEAGQVNPKAPTAGTEGTLQGEGEGGIRATGGGGRTFRCADVGNADCRWEAKGRTEDELMPQISDHARQAHGISKIDDQMRSKIKDAIHTRAA